MGLTGGHRRRRTGPAMSTTLMTQFSLTDDELQVLAARAAVEDFPTVLAVHPRHPPPKHCMPHTTSPPKHWSPKA